MDYLALWEARKSKRMDYDDPDLDHVPLIQRRKLLLPTTKQQQALTSTATHGRDLPVSQVASISDPACTNTEKLKLESSISTDFTDDLDHITLRERQQMLLSRKSVLLNEPFIQGTHTQCNSYDETGPEPTSKNDPSSSSFSHFLKVKHEPHDSNELYNTLRNAVDGGCQMAPVKQEMLDDLCGGMVVHRQFDNYMEPQVHGENDGSSIFKNFESLRKAPPFAVESGPTLSGVSNQEPIFRLRKRKKTATDSVETAMKEDAPELLQVLLDQGVSVDEIKLYGEANDDEPIDESFIEDGFSEFEDVMLKHCFQRNSIFKLAPIRCSKDSKPSYCLACLFSLVEQVRRLQFRNWPAEWGWCRDLQSFIFVFERHHRIVLERPEYGFATYFFELVDSVSIEWQIKRLVTTMKLTNCGRITLIENKELVVGEDISKGEAQVLKRLGWTPSSGLGTMLNYRDRVVHDKKSERDTSEWRSKIGKLLVDGFNGGTFVTDDIQPTGMEHTDSESPQIKMEL